MLDIYIKKAKVILSRLVRDAGAHGAHFRRFHVATVHMALDILVRNCSRDTRTQLQETLEKAALSTACVDFLRAASFEWQEVQTKACFCPFLNVSPPSLPYLNI